MVGELCAREIPPQKTVAAAIALDEIILRLLIQAFCLPKP
jgi:hypothetical protein